MDIEKLEKLNELRIKKVITKKEFDAAKKEMMEQEEASASVKSGSKNIITAYLQAWKKYVTFSGRSSRYDFWAFVFVNSIVSIILTFVSLFAGMYDILGSIYSLAVFIPSLAITVRRLHDVDRKGWWILFPYAAIAILGSIALVFALVEHAATGGVVSDGRKIFYIIMGIIALIITVAAFVYLLCILFKRGTQGSNRFGPQIVEDRKYNSRGLVFAIIMVAGFPFVSILIIAGVAGYYEAKTKYEYLKNAEGTNDATNLVIDVEELIENINYEYSDKKNFGDLNNFSVIKDELVPESFEVNGGNIAHEYGVNLFLHSTKDDYKVVITEVPEEACVQFVESYRGYEEDGFRGLSVNHGEPYIEPLDDASEACSVCGVFGCVIEINYHINEE